MSYDSTTVATIVSRISNGELVLPAIQRDFVWDPDRMFNFLDSWMRGYPFGTLLFWNTKGRLQYRSFVRDYEKGPESVEDLLAGAMSKERQRYERLLSFLATVGNNAPFIGLFRTVLGIIRAFKDLSANMAEASGAVMAGIAEALIATAVGLLVAIPAVIAFNFLKGRVKDIADDGNLLCATLLASLKSGDAAPKPEPAE